jgi:hypothetical protein
VRGEETISAGGSSFFDHLRGGSQLLQAEQIVKGLATKTYVSAFATQFVDSGGVAIDTVVEKHGQAAIVFGGTASNGVVQFDGGVVDGGSLIHEEIEAGGLVTLAGSSNLEMATAAQTVDLGSLILSQFSQVSDSIVKSGGEITVSGGGTANGVTLQSATVTSSGGQTLVFGNDLKVEGGNASGVKVASGSVEVVVAGDLEASYVYFGGAAIMGGGSLGDLTISSGGLLRWDVSAGEVVSGLTLRAGAEIDVDLTSVTATITGSELVLSSTGGTSVSASLTTEAGLGFEYDYSSAGQTVIAVTRTGGGTGPTLMAQAMAGQAHRPGVAGPSPGVAHASIGSTAELLKPR